MKRESALGPVAPLILRALGIRSTEPTARARTTDAPEVRPIVTHVRKLQRASGMR
ncbi:hypothetical protein DFR52_102658 [Hoeflea marina]|uniref:Uncharacterized protein n=1 Tax=Hoeflea marina TaxID=274592 RepID=A0A317PN65_9HYPH|nr:hypothetical protein DFR52_102658 [Hoeflea marina]